MKRLVTIAMLAGAMLAGLAAPALASTGTPAHSHMWWDNRTCAGFEAWQDHPTADGASDVAHDATHASYALRFDGRLWARDIARHARDSVEDNDAGFIGDDCNSYGQ